jgi:hypothetical protein
MPRRERVPVRWGFVLMTGVVVFGVIGAIAWYGVGPLSEDSQVRNDAISWVKRTLGR